MTINVERELRRGGVSGLFKKVGLLPRCQEWARGYGANLKGAWAAMPHPQILTYLALALGVPPEEVVEVGCGCVRMLMNDFGRPPQRAACAILDKVEAAVADAERAAYRPLYEATKRAGRWLHGADDRGEESGDILAVAAAANLAQAGALFACPCGQLHNDELDRAIDTALQMVTSARIAHALDIGRFPPDAELPEVEHWARAQTADAIRSQLPLELLTAPKLVSVPGVTPEGELVWSRRPRGQA